MNSPKATEYAQRYQQRDQRDRQTHILQYARPPRNGIYGVGVSGIGDALHQVVQFGRVARRVVGPAAAEIQMLL